MRIADRHSPSLRSLAHSHRVGALIEANERIVIALQLYDKLSNPSASDSEDEGGSTPARRQQQLIDAPSSRLTASERAAADDAEIEAVRQRLADADFSATAAAAARGGGGDEWEGEIEKLQFKQRRGIARHNSRLGDVRGGGGGGGGAPPGEAVRDLLDLDFDDTAHSVSAGPSLRPQRSSTGGTTAAGGASGSAGYPSAQGHSGTLSDYSDYDSSDDDQEPPRAHHVAGVPSGSASGASSAVRLDHGAELESWRQSRSGRHRPRIGEETSSLWSKEDEERWIRGDEAEEEQEEDDGGEDPFGDEWEEVAGKLRASGAESGRREWAAV